MAERKERLKKLVRRTGKYGYIYPDSNHFNEATDLDYEFWNYRLTKFRVWTGEKENRKIINGIQFFYKDLKNGKEKTLGEHKGETGLKTTEQVELAPNEYLTNFHIRIDQEVTQIGFDSSLGKTYLFGGETGEDKITETDPKSFDEGEKLMPMIFAPYGCTGNELQSCGVYFIDRKEFMKVAYLGYFELRYLLRKKPEFKAEVEKRDLSESDKALFRTCCLPDTAFNAIVKFCL